MIVRKKTIKGWASVTDLFFSENVTDVSKFQQGLTEFKDRELKGFKELNTAFDTLKGKGAVEKVIVYGWYWRGNWSDPEKRIHSVYWR